MTSRWRIRPHLQQRSERKFVGSFGPFDLYVGPYSEATHRVALVYDHDRHLFADTVTMLQIRCAERSLYVAALVGQEDMLEAVYAALRLLGVPEGSPEDDVWIARTIT